MDEALKQAIQAALDKGDLATIQALVCGTPGGGAHTNDDSGDTHGSPPPPKQ